VYVVIGRKKEKQKRRERNKNTTEVKKGKKKKKEAYEGFFCALNKEREERRKGKILSKHLAPFLALPCALIRPG
jgi:hypothetical protein